MIKDLLYRCGLLSALHRVRNRTNLTVPMFHRVLRHDDPAWRTANRAYTVSDRYFERCLAFFERHYHPIGLEALRRARRGEAALPVRPLLITFDDGWLDNLEVAAPILAAHGIPATVFVAVAPILEDGALWWQDVIDFARTEGLLPEIRLGRAAPGGTGAEAHYALLDVFERLPAALRRQILEPIIRRYGAAPRRQLLCPDQLDRLSAWGFEIGAHGFSHLPLTMLADPAGDLERARSWLDRQLGHARPLAFSFPHGRWSPMLVAMARSAGFDLIFTSEPTLTAGAATEEPLFGRVNMPPSETASPCGTFRPERAAPWLFLR